MVSFSLILSLSLVLLTQAKSVEVSADLKAASPFVNCGCQCSSLTFRDSGNQVQGNCRTVDGTGSQWCYVDLSTSTCQDIGLSQRFPRHGWSYEACATPTLQSYECSGYVPTVVVAPTDHVHVVAPPVPVVAPTDHVHVVAPPVPVVAPIDHV